MCGENCIIRLKISYQADEMGAVRSTLEIDWNYKICWKTLKEETSWKICSWEDNIKMELEGMGCEDVHWIHVNQGRTQWWAGVN
jgi:hypothetical protein